MSSAGFESVLSPTQNQSSPFSISDILSKEKKKSPTSHYGVSVTLSTPGSSGTGRALMFGQEATKQIKHDNVDTPKRPRKGYTSHTASRHPKLSLSEAGNMVPSSTIGYQGTHMPLMVTPHKPLGPSQINSSLVSPFNTNVLVALGHRPSPGSEEKEELFGDSSLGMLSEVAQYHGELSGTEANSSLEAPMREKMANIRLGSTDCSDIVPHETSSGEARSASLLARKVRKTSTPSILKRDKKRKRVLSAPHCSSSDESGYLSRHHASHLDAAFLSPLSNEKSSASKELTFSPSIFLSRPDHISSPDHAPSFILNSSIPTSKSETVAPSSSLANRFSVSPGSESECAPSPSDTDGGNFVTSTPIKSGKENVVRGSDSEEAWSPTILLSKRHSRLKETNESSSGSESDAVKRPCLHAPHSRRRKSKARTKLSPLLENACSPISKDAYQPSPLTTALATMPTRIVSVSLPHQTPLSATVSAAMPSYGSLSHAPPPQRPTFIGSSLLGTNVGVAGPPLSQKLLSSTTPITMNRPFPAMSTLLPLSTAQLTQPHQNLLLQNPLSRLQASLSYPLVSNSALQHYIPNTATGILNFPFVSLIPPPTVMAPPPSHHASYLSYNNPYSTEAQVMPMNSSYDSVGRNTSSKSVLDDSRRDSKQMQSVPPWFIFSSNRSEKRSRLTEAINKSLSETPSQTAKLPAEWTKLACGQTNDQKQLTEKARYFMQCRPRQLTFTDDMD